MSLAETGLTQIGRFEIRRRIGRGGMASVYAAFDPRLDREVAIKVLSPALTPDETLRQRFEREARVNVKLKHRAILPIHSLGETDDSIYIVMVLATGGSLEDRLRSGPLPPDEVVRIVNDVAAGLDHAHAQGIVHRDLKPGNVLFDDDGNPLISDFGIARFQGDASTRLTAGATIGTPMYLSPEQAKGEDVSGQTDVYALAIMAFEMLTGEPPFTGDTPIQVMYRHLSDPLPSGGLSPAVHRAIQRGTAKEVGDRHTTAGAFAKALADAIEEGVPVPRAAPKPHAPPEPRRTAERTMERPVVPAPMALPSSAKLKDLLTPAPIAGAGTAVVIAVALAVLGVGGWMALLLGALAGGAVALFAYGLRMPSGAAVTQTTAPGVQRVVSPPPERTLPPRPSHILEPGQRLADYRIIERLDEGSRTRVYHAFDERRERDVALRAMPMDDEAPDRVERLRREAALLGRLHHPHIVPFFDFGIESGVSYIVMPLLAGRSLATRIRDQGRLPLDLTLELTRQIAGALHYLHGVGIVSRDLKPTALVFDSHDNLYLADLRIAKDLEQAEDTRLTAAGKPLGTPTYMAPEQFLGDRVTAAADQYLLGCLVFEMLTGEKPFEADSSFALMLKHVREAPPSVCARRSDVPEAVDSALATALAKDPSRRYPDVLAFHDALVAAVDDARLPSGPRPQRRGHIFISYSKDDTVFAHGLADELRRRGLEVWIDARLEHGDQWWRVIVDAIDSCAAFVAVMTPSAYASRWVEREILLAERRGKPPFPVLRGGEVFPIYVATQYADARESDLPDSFFQRLGQATARSLQP